MSIYRPARSAPKDEQRIAKLLARAGIASRREVERMIAEGRVSLNGVVLDTPATILPSLDGVTVDGKPVAAPAPARLFLYHKPPGLLVTERDPAGRTTIYDRLPKDLPRLVPVGRLDLATEGLLLLTTDGELKRQLELPSTGVERAYRARAYGPITQQQLEELIHGIEIEGVRYGSINANLERRTGANVWIELILTEGKNREVRRVLDFLGLKVSRLIRTRYGPFLLGDLPPGGIGEVRGADVAAFRKEPTRNAPAEKPRPAPAATPVRATGSPTPPTARRGPAPRITRDAANKTDRAAFAEPARARPGSSQGIVVAKAPKVKRFYDAKPKAGAPAPGAAGRPPRANAAPAASDGRPARVYNPELGRNVRAKPARPAGAPGDGPRRGPGRAVARPAKPRPPKTRK